MIILNLTMNALLNKQEEIKQTLISMIESMSLEKGCRTYHVFRNLKDLSNFKSIGEWDSREDLILYLKSDKFGVLLGAKSLLSKPMKIRIQTVSNTEGIELVESIRNTSVLVASPKGQ